MSETLKENVFVRKDYTFLGWAYYANSTYPYYKDKDSIKLTEDLTLYAVWIENPVITFNGNGGTTSDSSTTTTQKVGYDKATALTANPFTKEGYTFVGWSTY